MRRSLAGPRTSTLLAVAALGLCLAAHAARAQLSVTAIPLAPHGPSLGAGNGAAVLLSPTALLVPASGPDATAQTADDLTLLVTDLDRGAVVTPLATPFLLAEGGASEVVRLTPGRALVASAGPDGTEDTTDDVVYLLDDLGAGNVVTPLTVGFLGFGSTWNPVRLADDAAAVASGLDEIKLLTGLGTANALTTLAAPGLSPWAGRPVALGASALLAAAGSASAGDVVYLFTDLGGANRRSELPTPFLSASTSGAPEPLGAMRAMVVGAGPDATDATVDDGVYLLDDLGGADAVTFIPVASILGEGGGAVSVLSPDLVVIATLGSDRTAATGDDLIVLITAIGQGNLTRGLRIAGLASGPGSRPVPLGATSFAVTTTGADLAFGTADDAVMVATNVGTLNGLLPLALGGLGPGVTTRAVAIDESALIVAGGGPDHVLGAGADDVVNVASGIPRTPSVRTAAAIGDFGGDPDPPAPPRLLGVDRAVLVSGGPDNVRGAGDDDLLLVVAGLLPVAHFQCYDVDREPFGPLVVSLEDPFGPTTFDLKRPRRLCNPASANREDPSAPAAPTHLVGYELRRPEPRFQRVRGVEVTNRFGVTVVDLLRPELLLVPTAAGPTAPAPALDRATDHFQCYQVRGARARARDLRLEDELGGGLVDVKRPVRLCAPADESGAGLFDPIQHLMCYEIRAARLPSLPRIVIDNDLGPEALTPRRARELCVPSRVTLPLGMRGGGT